MTWIDVLLAFAPLVVVSTALPLVGVDHLPPMWLRAAPLVALLLPEGPIGAVPALAWLAWCAALAARRAWAVWPLGETVACAYLAVGAAWLVVSRLGLTPFDFGETIVELTAVHFHYAGFAALALACASGSVVAVTAIAAGSVLVAVGHFGTHELDVAGAVALTFGLLVVADRSWRTGRLVLRLAALAVPASMALALVYALGRIDIGPSIDVQRMAQVHGTLNAVVLSWGGAVGWRAVHA
jgi:hypothetical protein